MSALDDKPLFSSRFKLLVHLLQLLLVSVAIGLTVPRLFVKNVGSGRSGTIALGMGAKSLVLLAYLLVSEHVSRFHSWHSYKAHTIIPGLEIVFWSAVAGLIFQANTKKSCGSVVCTLSWVVVGVAVVIVQSEIWCFCVSLREFRKYERSTASIAKTSSATSSPSRRVRGEEMQNMPTDSLRVEERGYTHGERRN